MKELYLTTKDNIRIAINHSKKLNTDSVLIICPGWYMSKDAIIFRQMFDDFSNHTDVIAMDFRGHGKSSGLFLFTAKEFLDLATVVNYAKQHYSRIIVMGFSLGAATAINYTAKHKDIDYLIAVSAPVEFGKIEFHFYKKESIITFFKKYEFKRAFNVRPGNIFLKKPKPIELIQDVSPIPVLFIAGEKDPIIYPWHSDELFNRAKDPKYITIFEKGFHAEALYSYFKEKFLLTIIEKALKF